MHSLTAFWRPVRRALTFPPWYRQHPDHTNDGDCRRGNLKIHERLLPQDTDVEEAGIDG
ncbi:hypothetical protein ACRALDRAFT_1075873, partial [Sodiomyces alcalophilus JCM 7366]|uniref:uncharacterized protein n=1 Tax=Sodiomyces alcalophilus JCM 7366 TaxID=591952 RepID=UPI0039B6CFA8